MQTEYFMNTLCLPLMPPQPPSHFTYYPQVSTVKTSQTIYQLMISKSTAQVHSPHLKFPALIILLYLTTFFILKHVLFLTSVSQTLLVLFHSLLTYFQSLPLNVDISPGENFQFDTIYMIMIPPNSILNPGVSGASDSYTLFLT